MKVERVFCDPHFQYPNTPFFHAPLTAVSLCAIGAQA